MPTHAVFLRGINVGGHRTVAMARLREVLTEAGFAEVATYIRSGNVTLAAPDATPAEITARAEAAIEAGFGFPVPVVAVTARALAGVVAANPFPQESDPKRVHVEFRARPVSAAARLELAAAQELALAKGSPDRVVAAADAVYLHTPDGLGRSVLAGLLARPRVAATGAGTIRNWATVLTMHALLTPTA